MNRSGEHITVGIIDYNCGNIKSVINALLFLGAEVRIISDPDKLNECNKIIFPGVGSFDHAVNNLNKKSLMSALKKWADNRENKLLGICLGMHLLCTASDESKDNLAGLDLIHANVVDLSAKITRQAKIPHMGWNSINMTDNGCSNVLMKNIKDGSDYYFVHSYAVYSTCSDTVIAETEHGGTHFASIIYNGFNVFGMQFHPEKSQNEGMQLLKNFIYNA